MQEALDRYGEENVRLWRTSVLRALPVPCRSQHGAAAVLHARAAPRAAAHRPRRPLRPRLLRPARAPWTAPRRVTRGHGGPRRLTCARIRSTRGASTSPGTTRRTPSSRTARSRERSASRTSAGESARSGTKMWSRSCAQGGASRSSRTRTGVRLSPCWSDGLREARRGLPRCMSIVEPGRSLPCPSLPVA